MTRCVVKLQSASCLAEQWVKLLQGNLILKLLILLAHLLIVRFEDAVHAAQYDERQEHVAYLALLECVAEHHVSDVPDKPHIGAVYVAILCHCSIYFFFSSAKLVIICAD